MSSKPSWLDDEETQQVMVSAAGKLASNPAVQKAVVNHVVEEHAPSWAKSTYEPPKVNGAGNDVEAQKSSSPQASGGDIGEFEGTPEEIRVLSRMRWILAFCYLVAAVNLCAAAALSLVNQNDVGKVFFAIYVFFFATILCCYEFAFGEIARIMAINLGFLYSTPGRLLFVVFVGIMSFGLSLYGIIAMCILFVAYLIHIYIRFTNPRFEEFSRKRHYFKPK